MSTRTKTVLAFLPSADFVASECGYASYDDFCRVFKRRVGSTVRKWTMGQTPKRRFVDCP